MITIGSTTVSQIYMGTKRNPDIYIGSYHTYPAGTITSAITNVQLRYSSGSAINAGGTNYAYIQGTLTTYIDGQQSSQTTVTLTPSRQSGSSSIWGTSGTHITAASRGTTTGSTRTATYRGTYQGYTSENFTVTQAANSRTVGAGAITAFELDGESGTINIDWQSRVMSVYLSGYRLATYSSGAQQQISAPFAIMTSEPWATANYTESVSISAYTYNEQYEQDYDMYDPRTVEITAYDTGYTSSVRSTITLVQTANLYELTVPTRKSIDANYTSFNIEVTSYFKGQPYAITQSMVLIGSNTFNVRYSSISSSNGRYWVYFSCSANTGQTTRSVNISISQPSGYTKTCTATQAAYAGYIEGINVFAEDGDWVLGTVDVSYNSSIGDFDRAIIVAKKTPNNRSANIEINNFQFKFYDGYDFETYSDYVWYNIPSGQTVTLTPIGYGEHTYYGYYVEFDSVGELYARPGMDIINAESFNVYEY